MQEEVSAQHLLGCGWRFLSMPFTPALPELRGGPAVIAGITHLSPEKSRGGADKGRKLGPGRLTLEVPSAPSAHGLGIQLGPQSHSRVTQPEASRAEEALFWGLRSLASPTDTLTDLRHCQALGGLTLSSAASAHLADHCLTFPVQMWKQLF